MNKKLLLTSAFAALLGTTVAQAQNQAVTDRKWDATLENLLYQQKSSAASLKTARNISKKDIILSCTDVQAVAEAIKEKGYSVTIIDNNIITASIPVEFIQEVANMKEVKYINAPRQFYPTMHSTRASIGVDKIHQGEGLETPFTGKGVIVGVIDQGFEYKHVAFLDKDGNSRVRAVWNHYSNQAPTTSIAKGGDNIADSHGHASHVTCIAAGSKVKGNEYYGIAPEADIIMIPSNFREDNVLKEAKYIADFAKKEGKPYVINMSFGSQIGAHDGTSTYDQGMNKMSIPGGILVAAMGNEGGQQLHAHYKFKNDKEKVYLIVSNDDETTMNYVDLWGQATDGKSHLKTRPFIYNKATKSKDFKNETYWRSLGIHNGNIDPNNNKEHFAFQIVLNQMQRGNTAKLLGIEIEGNTGDEFHAWVNPGFGEFKRIAGGGGYISGDNEFCVGEGAACIPKAIAVASYNANNGSFKSAIDGKTYGYGGTQNEISDFSSRGPYLGTEHKPLVAAPGNNVCSAISRYGQGFDKTALDIVSIIAEGINRYYYASMCGTSMASPAVTGTVALWLEANPELTYEQIEYIIKSTAKLDAGTGTINKWDNKRGFGKIDAYAGLKKALEMAEHSGISDQLNNSTTPVTLMKETDQTRILFNNDETYATISLYNANGMEVKREQLQDIRRGQETTVSTLGLPKGVYILRISTTAHTTAKKMLVK